jgi:hypothetical protein
VNSPEDTPRRGRQSLATPLRRDDTPDRIPDGENGHLGLLALIARGHPAVGHDLRGRRVLNVSCTRLSEPQQDDVVLDRPRVDAAALRPGGIR